MTEQAQSFHDDGDGRDALADGAAGPVTGEATGTTKPAGTGREVLDAIDHLMSVGSGTPAREALDAISLRLGDAYAALDTGAAAIPDAAAREAAEREARRDAEDAAAAEAERDSAEKAARAREAFEARHGLLLGASRSLNLVLGAAAEISALLTWRPDRPGEAAVAVGLAGRGLADLRSYLSALDAPGTVEAESGQARDPHNEFPQRYAGSLDALRELHRQIGAHIALIELDVGNTPAVIAMERVVAEHAVRANVMCQGLGMVLAEVGMVR